MGSLKHVLFLSAAIAVAVQAEIPCRSILWNGEHHQFELIQGIRLLKSVPVKVLKSEKRMRLEELNHELGWQQGQEKILFVIKEVGREVFIQYKASQWMAPPRSNAIGSLLYYGLAWPYTHSFHWQPVRIDSNGRWTSLDASRGVWVEANSTINHDAIYMPLSFATSGEQEKAMARLKKASGGKAYVLSCAQGTCHLLSDLNHTGEQEKIVPLSGYRNFFETLSGERSYQVDKVLIHGTHLLSSPGLLPKTLKRVDWEQTQLFMRIGMVGIGSAVGGGYLLLSLFDDD